MPNIIDHVSYLSEEIGPRPAGTEEEQQAALYITEFMQKEAGLSTSVEDFTATSNPEMASIICGALLVVCAVLGIAFPAAGVVAFIGAFIGAALQILEALDKPVLSGLFGKGISQNVVAKYEPEQEDGDASSRHRKVVLVSHYDSGKVRAELNDPVLGLLPILKLVSLGCTVLVPILLLIKTIALGEATGAAPVVVSVLLVIALVFAVLPFISAVVHRLASYNAGANCNASGVAVLMEAASRVGRPSSAAAGEAGGAPVVHGEEAARNEGLIPDGVQVTYDVPTTPASSAEARLAQAKAAVAALSGKPVAGAAASFDISENLAQAKDKPVGAPSEADLHQFREETLEAFAPRVADAAQAVQEKIAEQAAAAEKRVADAARAADSSPIEGYLERNAPSASTASADATEIRITPEAMPESVDAIPAEPVEQAVETASASPASAPVEEKPAAGGVPDWFVRAQQNAKKPKDDGKPVHRSRYADALDAAVSESSVHFKEANEAVVSETEQRLAAMRDSIREIKAPGFEGEEVDEVFSVFTQEREKIAEEKVSDLPDWSMPSWNVAAAEPAVDEPITVPAVEAEATPISEEPKHAGDESAPRVQKDAPRTQADDAPKAPTTEQYATTAMPPIDVSDLRDKPAPADAPVTPFVEPITAEVAKSAVTDAPSEPKEDLAPVAELTKQRAPLADPSKPKNKATSRLRAQIPSILSPSEAISQDVSTHKSSEAQTALRSSLPSLSSSITREDAKSHVEEVAQTDATVTLAAAGTFAPASATGSFAPVDEELFENVDPDEIYVDDADDSDYEGAITETGAFAGPGYVEMPKSRVRKFFDKFHFGKHKKEEESTPQEWLDVDDSFDARSVGAERGSWESFREESEFESVGDDGYDDYDDGYADDEYEDSAYDGQYDADDEQRKSGRGWNGGAFSRISMGNANVRSGEEFEDMAALENEHTPAQEMEQIYRFHNPDISTEVWFVALGSDLSGHNGMKAFLAEHAQELRGAMIVDLEALGAGDLSLIETEGVLKKSHASSRMKRFIKKASSASGAHVGSARIEWGESSASIAAKQGFQSMHLVGMDGLKPAYFGQEDDVVANVDAKKLTQSTDFVMELLKNI